MLLVFLILTPALACAMPVCKEQPAAENPCPEHLPKHGEEAPIKLMKDCMGVDVAPVHAPSLVKKYDASPDASPLVAPPLRIAAHLPDGNEDIHFQPAWDDPPPVAPSLFLITRRLRI